MTIAEYQALTGTTVSDADAPRVKAAIRRAELKLEGLLGYPLSRKQNWTDLGRVSYNGLIPFPSLPLNDVTRASAFDAEDPEGEIRLFNLDWLDTNIRITPAREVYRVKVVLPVNESEFLTIEPLDHATPYLNDANLAVAITRNNAWFTWPWWHSLEGYERSNLMLAVDATYVNLCDGKRYPDLAFLLADMVSYYSDPSYSVMGNIRSESIDSHSYSRASTGKDADSSAPEGQRSAMRIIEKYAGPGAFRKLVR